MSPARLRAVAAALIATVAIAPLAPSWSRPTPVHALGIVTVTGVATDNSSVKVQFKTDVPGAADYRVIDLARPALTKYAGIIHPTDASGTTLSVPNDEIEWNEDGDGRTHTLVVQAVDQLGPSVEANQVDEENNPLAAGGRLGSDAGPTPDGMISINGQGTYTDTPQVIAQSQPFTIQTANSQGKTALPSAPDAQQTFFDTFDNAEGSTITTTVQPDLSATAPRKVYTLNAGTDHAWTIQAQDQDFRASNIMVMGDHFMDDSFDGGTPGGSDPLHVQSSTLGMIPTNATGTAKAFDFSGGQVLHITYEVDMHLDGNAHRWVGVYVTPANDPITNFDFGNGTTSGQALNNSDTGVEFRLKPDGCEVAQFEGPLSATDADPRTVQVYGAAGQATNYCAPRPAGVDHNGRGLDDRSRVDIFMSGTQFALFEDGALVAAGAWDQALPFSAGQVDYVHYVYDTSHALEHLAEYQPYESFWRTIMTESDERHWDNMGAEVLPARYGSSDLSALSGLIQDNSFTFSAPQFTSGGATPTNTPAPTATATDAPQPTATPTMGMPMPTNTPTATDTPTVDPTATDTPGPTDTATATAMSGQLDNAPCAVWDGAKLVSGTCTGTFSPSTSG